MAKKVIDYSKPLANMKQERFCQERITGRNCTQSAKTAGYKQPRAQGSRMKGMVHVAGRIAYLQSLVQERSQITIEKVIDNIKDTHRRAVLAGDEFAAENKCSDMFMKHLGGYEKDNEYSLGINVIIDK